MSDCRRVVESLPAYADDLLHADERGRIERHLLSCLACRQLADAERGGRTLLRRGATRLLAEPLPQDLRGRCEALAAGGGGSRAALSRLGPWWRVRLVPVTLTVVVMIFTASAVLSLATRRSDAILAAQLTADHAKCFKLFAPPEGTSADARGVERMLAEQYGWNVRVPPSSADDNIQLVGARRCLYGDGLVPHVMYRVHGRDVSLFVLPGTTRAADDLLSLGHRSQIWSRDGTTFVLISPADAGGIPGASRYVMREAR